ncbi:Piso0_002466 [Millerozyma farinosa CBS 7064]|uniref:Piso0_002466 protein n=1 Tax=Pichia sorbitophila (strain ATCC MYA-4447 / BCRC 22081 / CBS 7064 / NBRC 10061 / NRRL Y-12695) TaxID=559304 RepID=G8YF45_PICSO|nr:Piso0_002466 [Millerozyma farinosa CBS 7064]
MSELQGLKKAELYSICRKVGIHALAKDTKKVLFDKLSSYIEKNPEEGLLAVQKSLEEETDDEDEQTLAENVEETDEEEDDEEEDDEEEDDEEEEEEEDEDKDYKEGAPIDLKEWIVDPLIEKFELVYGKVLDFTDSVGITTLDYNDELRENLSSTVTLNYVELFAETVVFLLHFVAFVPLKDNESVLEILKSNIEFLSESELITPDFSPLFTFKALSVFTSWLFTAVLLPLLFAYYINFSRRLIIFDEDEEDSGLITRAYKFDPFIFSLSKVLLYFFISRGNGPLIAIDPFGGIINALKTHILIQIDIYRNFVDILGSFPLVLGIANILTAIYSQFEEY